MPDVNRICSIPDDISLKINKAVPDKRRSKFTADSLRENPRERKRNELLYLLSDMPRKENPDNRS